MVEDYSRYNERGKAFNDQGLDRLTEQFEGMTDRSPSVWISTGEAAEHWADAFGVAVTKTTRVFAIGDGALEFITEGTGFRSFLRRRRRGRGVWRSNHSNDRTDQRPDQVLLAANIVSMLVAGSEWRDPTLDIGRRLALRSLAVQAKDVVADAQFAEPVQ